jgi:hypothetical protein
MGKCFESQKKGHKVHNSVFISICIYVLQFSLISVIVLAFEPMGGMVLVQVVQEHQTKGLLR